MLTCWNEDPDKRPSFRQLYSTLNHLAKGKQVLKAIMIINFPTNLYPTKTNNCGARGMYLSYNHIRSHCRQKKYEIRRGQGDLDFKTLIPHTPAHANVKEGNRINRS